MTGSVIGDVQVLLYFVATWQNNVTFGTSHEDLWTRPSRPWKYLQLSLFFVDTIDWYVNWQSRYCIFIHIPYIGHVCIFFLFRIWTSQLSVAAVELLQFLGQLNASPRTLFWTSVEQNSACQNGVLCFVNIFKATGELNNQRIAVSKRSPFLGNKRGQMDHSSCFSQSGRAIRAWRLKVVLVSGDSSFCWHHLVEFIDSFVVHRLTWK